MTVHLISVGDSVLKHLADTRKYFTDPRAGKIEKSEPWLLLRRADVHRSGEEASAWLESALTPPGAPSELLTEMAAQVSPGLWPARLSAELQTFDRVPETRSPLPRKDIAVLLCSDTPDGLLAGLWNAVALVDGDLSRARYVPAPGQQSPDMKGKAAIVRIPGLETGRDAGFREAMRGLGQFGRTLLDGGEVGADEPFRFYLSGGFKASLPYLIGLAEGLRSLHPKRDVQAYVLHEFTKSAPIRLPLRLLIARTVRADLGTFTNGTRDTKPEPGVLEGYAYEEDRDAGKWRLTPFGEGLRALFGPPDEALQR